MLVIDAASYVRRTYRMRQPFPPALAVGENPVERERRCPPAALRQLVNFGRDLNYRAFEDAPVAPLHRAIRRVKRQGLRHALRRPNE